MDVKKIVLLVGALLIAGVTVVFSGRKMGKSSLLSRLQAQCSAETGQRAILVGCSGIASGRSRVSVTPSIAVMTRSSVSGSEYPF